MSTSQSNPLLGKISVFALQGISGMYVGESGALPAGLTNGQKIWLAAGGIVAYLLARVGFGLVGLPAEPNISSLLLLDQPFYAAFLAGLALVVLTLLTRAVIGSIRFEAPLFVAAIGLLALPTHGGDVRNALHDAGSASVFVRMIVELGLLSIAVIAGYVLLGLLAVRATPVETIEGEAVQHPNTDTLVDRLTTTGLQALLVLALMSFLGQSPMKGQAMLGLALAGGLGAWVTYKSRQVAGSLWPVLGTLLAGIVAYAWSFLHPDGLALGDIRNSLSGAAYSLPLHYVTAGVAGTIYGYWVARSNSPLDLGV